MFSGLLDSGANISILGKGCENLLNDPNIKFYSFPSSVKTANGQVETILGYVKVPVSLAGKTSIVTLHLAPNLTQQLYLGIDFWHLFDLKIYFSPVSSTHHSQNQNSNKTLKINSKIAAAELHVENEPQDSASAQHSLNEEQKQILKQTIAKFPSSAILGLGRTTYLKHTIDVGNAKPVKQRHYPVSPAVEAEMYQELDRMLALGMIEVSVSSWCSPIAWSAN